MKIPRLTLTALSALTITTVLGLSGAFAETPATKAKEAATPADARKANPTTGNALITREWKVPADFHPGAEGRETAKDWLISKGIVFEGQASAVYIARSNRFIVRNTQAQLDLIDVLVDQAAAKGGAVEKKGHAPVGALEKKANDSVIPKLEFRDASVADALKTITTATGIKVFYNPTDADDTRINLSLTNVPASEALRYVTSLANLKFTYEKDGVHVAK